MLPSKETLLIKILWKFVFEVTKIPLVNISALHAKGIQDIIKSYILLKDATIRKKITPFIGQGNKKMVGTLYCVDFKSKRWQKSLPVWLAMATLLLL